MKLNRRCPACGAHLNFMEQEDSVYVLCKSCCTSVYVPVKSAAECATDFPTLIKLMAAELADLARRIIKKEEVRRQFGPQGKVVFNE